jgi:hypothetical protein
LADTVLMKNSLGLALALWGLAAVLASPAGAGVPDPLNTTADTCLVLAPGGNFSYSATLRDESFAPIADVQVTLDFGPAPGIVLCAASDPDLDRRVVATSNSVGSVVFNVGAGGQSTGYVVLAAVGGTIRILHPRTTDQTRDLQFTVADVNAHAALPVSSRLGDYDCDGDSDAADRAIISAELGQNCSSVPVLSSTWGRLKNLYR